MSGIEYGTDEHLDGLSRNALKSEVRWWYGVALVVEDENAELRELVRDMWNWLAPTAIGGGAPMQGLYGRMHELGVEV